MPDMPCYPYVTKDHRTIMNDRELLDWIREKAGDDMAELVRLVCILFGSLMMLAAFRSGNIKLAIVAFLILLVGILFAEEVEDVLERFRIVFTWLEL